MPPLRTITPIPANKTERSHAENQERAYIAASRRNDRSLEARVESARRASEIHRRRTGRSLRITEQDVLNEEMYEEEDDGLPLHYRRLAAHLYTGSAHFNPRLAAYLTDQVCMRSAMTSIHQDTLIHQYPPSPHYHINSFQSPVFHSPEPSYSHISYSSAPYPSPPFQAIPKPPHTIPPTSYFTPTTAPLAPHQSIHSKPMSTPAGIPQNTSIPTHAQSQNPQCDLGYVSQPPPANFSPQLQYYPTSLHHVNPFHPTQPPEAQQMVDPALDTADYFHASLMHSSENYIPGPNSNYPWGANPIAPANGMPAHVHPSIPKNSSSTMALAPSPMTATTTTMTANQAPSESAITPHTPNSSNAQDRHKDNSAPLSDFDFDHNNSSSQEVNTTLVLSSSDSHNSPLQAVSPLSTPPKSFLPKDTAAAANAESDSLDSDQNLHGPDGFWDHFLHDATWHHHDDLAVAAIAPAIAAATATAT